MASSVIHLAVAKKFLEKNPNLNKKEVLKGSLYPDTVKKDISHYTDLNRGTDNVSHLKGKVNLYSFLLDHENLNDFEIGWFIHLVTDYLFFDECFTENYLLTHTYDEFRDELYTSYDYTNNYISEKYNITMEDYESYPNEYYPGKEYQECLFTKEMLDNLINHAGNINLSVYIEKIKKHKGNIKPED